MNCPEFEIPVALYAEGDLAGAQAAVLEAHLRGCAECRRLLDAISASQAALKQLRMEPLEPGACESVRARVLAQIGKRRRHWFWARLALAGACGAAFLGVFFWPEPPAAPPVPRVVRRAAPPAPPAPVVRARHVRKKSRPRPVPRLELAAAPVRPSDAALVRVHSSDPEVVIYWVLDSQGASE